MRHILGVSFGHNDKFNSGANGILNEDIVNRQVGQELINIIKSEDLLDVIHLVRNDVTSYEDSVQYRPLLANEKKCTLIIDIHHNAYNKNTAHGSEMLTMSEEAEKLGLFILNELTKLGYRNRGTKHSTLAFNRLSKMPSVIYEGFFITNQEDCNKYSAKNEARAIANGIYTYLGLTKPADKKREYIVVKGDTLWSISKKLNTTVEDLVEQNKIKNKNLIFIGQKLFY